MISTQVDTVSTKTACNIWRDSEIILPWLNMCKDWSYFIFPWPSGVLTSFWVSGCGLCGCAVVFLPLGYNVSKRVEIIFHCGRRLLFSSCHLSASFHLDGWHVSTVTLRLWSHAAKWYTCSQHVDFISVCVFVVWIDSFVNCACVQLLGEVYKRDSVNWKPLVRFVASVGVLELHYFWTKSREYCTNCVNRCYFSVLGLLDRLLCDS